MKRFRANNQPKQTKSFKGSNPFLPDENDLPDYLLHPTSNKAAKTKLKQANIKGYIDLSSTKLDSIPEEVFKPNTPIDGINWWLNVDITKIDASNNNLTENAFNDSVHDFRNIPYTKILSLSSNRFNIIPMSIYYLQNLIFFDISNNMITEIDENLFTNLSHLININFSGNKLKYFPRSIKYMTNLLELDISKNELMNIPDEFIYLKNLKKLNISYNKIQLIQMNLFSNLLSLEELYCNNNLITNMQSLNNYTIFNSIPNLKILNISYNQLQEYIIFKQIPNLEKINISYNKLKNILGLSSCPKLIEIDCSNNNIKQFPTDFFSVINLHSLNLNGNELNTLPGLIYLMDNLVQLNIEGNPMKQASNLKYVNNISQIKQFCQSKLSNEELQNMPENLKQNYFRKINNVNNNNNNQRNKNAEINKNSPLFNYIKNNSELVINNTELIEIPCNEILKSIPENFLTVIDLSGNQIEKGLDSFQNIIHLLNCLKILNLAKNNIKYFPLILLNLPSLEELNLSRNLLTNFPSEIINQNNTMNITQSLQILDLSNNKIEIFPLILGFFKNLRILNLTCNKIKEMNSLCNMRFDKLEKFLIDDNQISEIPSNVLFRSIPNVETFTISNNNLSDIPTDIFLLVFLTHINFYGNYIRKIQNEYLLNAEKIKNYLKKYHVYTDEQKYFEMEQEEKLRQKQLMKEKERLNKISPNYNSSGIQNYFNSNFNPTNFNKRKIVNDIFGSSNNNMNNNINNNIHLKNKKNINNINNENNQRNINDIFNLNKTKRSLEDINREIYEIESQMQSPGLQPHIKASLKKKFISLIRERANVNK